MAAIAKLPEPPRPAPARALDWRAWLLLFVGVLGAEALILGAVAARRPVNADEGFYLSAGWQVLHGRHLYADFFFPQMPYLPYAEAAVLAWTGPSLFAGRAISAAGGALLAAALAVAAARRSGDLRVGLAVALLYAANALVLNYVSIAKTYGAANLLLVSAVLLIAVPSVTWGAALAAGVCAGLAVGTRLPTAAVAMVLLAWCLWQGRRQACAFAAGALLASLPWLVIAAQDPQSFWFGNFGFHALRREISGVGPIVRQKAIILAKWVLLPQNLVLWVLAVTGVRRRSAGTVPLVAAIAVLGAVYLWATPTYLDYFVQLVPLLLLAAGGALAILVPRRGLAGLALGVYLVGLVLARRSAPDESARGAKAQLWRLSTVRAVTDYIQTHSAPDQQVLSWWEGYPFLANRPGVRGVGFWESNAAKKLSAPARQRFHLLNAEDIRALIVARQPQLIVVPDDTWRGLRDAIAAHYQAGARFGTVQIFVPRDAVVEPTKDAA